MSAQALDVSRRQQELMAAQDWDGAMALMHPQASYTPHAELQLESATYRGHEEIRGFWRRWLGTWDDYSWEATEFLDAEGGRAVVVGQERGRGRGSGIEVDRVIAVVNHVQDGLIIESHTYPSAEEALAAADLGQR